MDNGYKRPEKMASIAEAIAHFLDWNAIHNPKKFVSLAELTVHVMGLSRRPNMNSATVQTCSKELKKAKTLLEKKYNRLCLFQRSSGYRATSSDQDKLIPVAKQAKGVEGKSRRLREMVAPIDPSTFSKDEEGKRDRQQLLNYQDATHRLTSDKMRQLLLPPGSPDLEK
jgi:hypothetical protein